MVFRVRSRWPVRPVQSTSDPLPQRSRHPRPREIRRSPHPIRPPFEIRSSTAGPRVHGSRRIPWGRPWIEIASSITWPGGSSSAGRRVARGTELPAMKGDSEFLGRFVHLLGPIPAVREMFVIEKGDESSRAFHGCHALIEEPFPRVHDLPEFGSRIAAVLANGQHGIDGQFLPHRHRGRRRSS